MPNTVIYRIMEFLCLKEPLKIIWFQSLWEKDRGLSLKQRKNKFWIEDVYYLLMANNFKRTIFSVFSQFYLLFLVVGVYGPEAGHIFLTRLPFKTDFWKY